MTNLKRLDTELHSIIYDITEGTRGNVDSMLKQMLDIIYRELDEDYHQEFADKLQRIEYYVKLPYSLRFKHQFIAVGDMGFKDLSYCGYIIKDNMNEAVDRFHAYSNYEDDLWILLKTLGLGICGLIRIYGEM